MLFYLFKKDFSIELQENIVNAESCSVRAEQGITSFREQIFRDNSLNFYLALPNAVDSTGSLTFENSEHHVSYRFRVKEILSANLQEIVLAVEGEGSQDGFPFTSEGTIRLDKLSETISLSLEDIALDAQNLQITFKKGCFNEIKMFYIITNNGDLEDRRSIKEIREFLDQYLMIEDNFESLGILKREYWALVLPDGLIS
jgi:hypothetical protein